jgi:hypothetical protein
MTAERVARLTSLGFVWEASTGSGDEAVWEAQLALLAAYKVEHGDCNVPHGWAGDPRLAGRVKNQRQRKRKHYRGEPSHSDRHNVMHRRSRSHPQGLGKLNEKMGKSQTRSTILLSMRDKSEDGVGGGVEAWPQRCPLAA